MIKVVCFDFDNTIELWLPIEEHTEDFMSLYVEQTFGVPAKEFVDEFRKIKMNYVTARSLPQDYGRKIWFSETLAHFKVNDPPVDDLVEMYWKELVKGIDVFPGTYEMLEELKKHYRLAILSDSDGDPSWKDLRLSKLNMHKYFDVILTSHEIGVNKPHPRGFLRVAHDLGAKPEQCVMVGDNPPVDLEPAKKLGFTTIWTREGVEGERRDITRDYIDFTVDSIKEVPEIVSKASSEIGD